MVKNIKRLIKELRYKRFEREVSNEINKGKTMFSFDGFEYEVVRGHHVKDEDYMCFCESFIRDKYKEAEGITTSNISYDLNDEVPKLYIKGREVGVVSMTKHYVTNGDTPGTNVITFIYITKDSPAQRVLSIDLLTDVVLNQ